MKHLQIFKTESAYKLKETSINTPYVVTIEEPFQIHYKLDIPANTSLWYKIDGTTLYITGHEKDGYSERVLYADTTLAKNGWYNASNKASITKAVIEETIAPTSCARLFDNCTGLEEIEGFEKIKMWHCTSCYCMFQYCSKLVSINCTEWGVNNINDMAYMFNKCNVLTSVGDISNWNVSNVTSMKLMFQYCYKLTSVGDLSNWDTGKVTDMSLMFYDCNKLHYIGDLSNWNVANVNNVNSMFANCILLINPKLSKSIKIIGAELYINCYGVDTLEFDHNLEKIGLNGLNVTYNDCFPSCLEKITISGDNPNFKSINDEIVLSKDGKYCYGGAGYKISIKYSTYEIPEGVTHLISGAFRSLAYATPATELESVNRIIQSTQLNHIILPSTLEWIGDRVCQYAKNCSTLTVKAVTPPTFYGSVLFGNVASDFKIYVPAESVDAYKTAAGWSKWATKIYAIED